MLGTKKYKFRLARALDEACELEVSFQGTWDVINQTVAAGFAGKMTGAVRYLQVVKTASSEVVGDKITDAGKFWLGIVKWYDADTTAFTVFDDSLVGVELQLQSAESVVVKRQTPFMGSYDDLLSLVHSAYSHVAPGAVRHFSPVRGGAAVDLPLSSAEQLWDWFAAISATRDPARFIVVVKDFAKVEVALSVTEKFPIYVPRDCSLDLLGKIVLETVSHMKGKTHEVDSLSVRSVRGSESLTSVQQLTELFDASASWLFVSLRAAAAPAVAASVARKPVAAPKPTDGTTHEVRFCLSADRSACCTVPLAQGMSMDEIKAIVAAMCTDLTAADIKHFVLLDKDGDEFSSGLDTVTKFWRIALKYFKVNAKREFVFSIVLNKLSDSARKPTVRPQAEQAEQATPAETPPAPAPAPTPAPVAVKEPVAAVVELASGVTALKILAGSAESSRSPSVAAAAVASPISEASPVSLKSSLSASRGAVINVSPSSGAVSRAASMKGQSPVVANAHGPRSPVTPDAQELPHSKPEPERPSEATKTTSAVPAGNLLTFKLAPSAQKSVMPSRRLELLRKKERESGGSSIDADLFPTHLPYGCSWSVVLDCICKVTGVQAPSDISHLIPLVNGKPIEDKGKESTLVVDRFQFWAVNKRAGNAGDAIVWEVHAGSKGSGGGQQAAKGSKVAESPSVHSSGEQRSVVVSVALASSMRVVKPALIPLSASWEELTAVVSEALHIDRQQQTLTHFIVFDKDGDQLTTEISTAAKFWKIQAFGSTVLRVYVTDKNAGAAEAIGCSVEDLAARDSPLTVGTPTAEADAPSPGSVASSGGGSARHATSAAANDGSELISVTIAHARHPRKEFTVNLRLNSSWSAISSLFSKALGLPSNVSIAYIMVYDREDRKFGSAITASDRFWKNISYYSHHVLRMYTIATLDTEPEGSKSYRAALSGEPSAYKTISYSTIPTMDDIRNAVSAHFQICADIVMHVVFFDADGDELSGPLNADSKLVKFFQHKDVNIRVFTSVPPTNILPRLVFTLEAANGPQFTKRKTVSISRNPTWEEFRLEIAEELQLEKVEMLNHVVFVDDEGDELSGNVNSDIKVTKFTNSAGNLQNIRLRVFLDKKEKSETADSFFSLVADQNIPELDKCVNSKFFVDKPNPANSRSAFLFCCEHGKMESLKWLLQRKANINQRSPEGSNGLHIAITSGCNEVVDYLVAMGISTFDPDGSHLTPFLLACYVGNVRAAKLLLRKGSKKSDAQRNTGYMGIHLAVLQGNLEMLQFLVDENGVSIEACEKSGMTPFLLACSCGQLAVARWLVDRGCNSLAVSSPQGESGGSSALHFACESGLVETVVYLLDLGLPTNAKDAKGVSVVEKAKQCGHIEIADMILDREILAAGTLDVELFFRLLELRENARAQTYLENFMKDVGFKYSDEDKILLFHLASACGHKYIVEYFMMIGCDINSKYGAIEATPLLQACTYGQLEVVKYLVAHGADISVKDASGVNAMRVAVLSGHAEVASFLEETLKERKEKERADKAKLSGVVEAPPPAPTSLQSSNFGMLFACISGMDANPTASQLFTPPVDDDIESCSGSEDYEYSDESGHGDSKHSGAGGAALRPVEASSHDLSAFALHNACRSGASVGLIRVLIEPMKGQLDLLDDEGYTSLYIACAFSRWDIAIFLIENGADVSLLCERVGETPLHVICHFNVTHVLKRVLQLRAQRIALSNININKIIDVNENSLLHVAVLGDATETAVMLADDTEIDLDGLSAGRRTPLHLACINKHPSVGIELINRDADIFARDAVGGSALLYAVKSSELELVRCLLAKGADVKDKTETGNTAMHIVCQTGDLDMAIFLVNNRASLLERNEQGLTPYSYAVKLGHTQMIQWIATVDRKATL